MQLKKAKVALLKWKDHQQELEQRQQYEYQIAS
jgi:hypothetical protein